MNWGEFKAHVEANGVHDLSEISVISVDGSSVPVVVTYQMKKRERDGAEIKYVPIGPVMVSITN